MIGIRVDRKNEIQVQHSVFRKRRVMSVRKFYRLDPGSPWKPTSKGIAFDSSRAQEVIDAMIAELEIEPVADTDERAAAEAVDA